MTDGRRNDLDILICATGFDVSYHYPFDVVGRRGVKLTDRWTPHAETYLSLAVDGFPNLFFMYGPGSALNTGTTISILEHQAEYLVKVTLKLQRERLKAMEPKRDATADWMQQRQVNPYNIYFSD